MSRACVNSIIWLVLSFHSFTPDLILAQPTYSLDDWMSVSTVTGWYLHLLHKQRFRLRHDRDVSGEKRKGRADAIDRESGRPPA